MLVMHAHNQVRQTQSKDLYVNALQDHTVQLNMDVAVMVMVLHQQQCAGDQAYRSSQAIHQQVLLQQQQQHLMSLGGGGGLGGSNATGGGYTHTHPSNKRTREYESTHALHSYTHPSTSSASSSSGGGAVLAPSQYYPPDSQVHMTVGGRTNGAGSSSSSSSSSGGGGGGSNKPTVTTTVSTIGYADLLLQKLQNVDILPSFSSSLLFPGGGGGGSGQLPPAVAMHIEGLFLLVAALATKYPGGEFLTPVPSVMLTGPGLGPGLEPGSGLGPGPGPGLGLGNGAKAHPPLMNSY